LAVAQLKEGEGDLSIKLAAPLSESVLYEHFSHLIEGRREVSLNESSGSLQSLRLKALGAITLTSQRELSLSPEELSDAFTSWLSSDVGFATITWTHEAASLRQRALWASASGANKNLPDLSDVALKLTVKDWLIPFLPYPPAAKSLSPSLVESALMTRLSWGEKRELDRVAPRSLTLPSGRAREIHYPINGNPYLEAKIQELFGIGETPTIGDPMKPLNIHLLSPAGRPVQVTNDLKSFWKTGYPTIRRELRGRYPKHKWPEDPP
jgi:ATP-dependent helicase HrpB